MSPAYPATVGILAEPYLNEWQVRAIEQLQFETGIEIPVVVINSSAEWSNIETNERDPKDRLHISNVRRLFDAVRRERAWAMAYVEREFGWLIGDDEPLIYRHAIENVECLNDAEYIRCEPRMEGSWAILPEEIVKRVEESCDVVFRTGFGLLRGEILTAPKYGILSFHTADIRKYRGMGPEVVFFDNQPIAGSTLQRLNATIDGGEIIAFDEVDIRDCYTLWDVKERIYAMQIRLLTEGVKNLSNPTFEPVVIPEDQLGKIYYRNQRRTPEFAGRIVKKNLYGRIQRRILSR
jgi:methionyl-tRNA formyltransferase